MRKIEEICPAPRAFAFSGGFVYANEGTNPPWTATNKLQKVCVIWEPMINCNVQMCTIHICKAARRYQPGANQLTNFAQATGSDISWAKALAMSGFAAAAAAHAVSMVATTAGTIWGGWEEKCPGWHRVGDINITQENIVFYIFLYNVVNW